MDEYGISLRTFNDSSLNRLRSSERIGDSLLNSNGIQMNGNCIGSSPSSSRLSNILPEPPSNILNNERNGGFIEQYPPANQNHNDDDGEDDEVSLTLFHNHSSIIPSRQQVLYYLSSSNQLLIQKADREIQITDTSNFPLFDIWAEKIWCSGSLWVMESYGRRVVIISDTMNTNNNGWRTRRGVNIQSVIDWNNQILAYFLPGDPFLIQNSQRQTIIRCSSLPTVEGRRENWECILEEAGREAARLDNGQLRFSPQLGFQLKLLIISALSRALTTPRSSRSCFSFLRH